MLRDQKRYTNILQLIALIPIINGCAGNTLASSPVAGAASLHSTPSENFSFSSSVPYLENAEPLLKQSPEATPLKFATSVGELTGLLIACGMDKDAVHRALAGRLLEIYRIPSYTSKDTLRSAAVLAALDQQNRYKGGADLNCANAPEALRFFQKPIGT